MFLFRSYEMLHETDPTVGLICHFRYKSAEILILVIAGLLTIKNSLTGAER